MPYFSAQTESVIQALAGVAVQERFPGGGVLFVQGERSAGLYLVHSGTVRLCRFSADGREYTVRLMARGDTFNEVPALDGGPNPVTAVANVETVVWRFAGISLQDVCRRHPTLAWALAGHVAGQARHLLGQAEDLAIRTVRSRLALLLLDLARQHDGTAVPRTLTQEEMAGQLGTVREMVSRALRHLADQGIIEVDRHRIVILDPDRLAEVAGT